MFSTYVFRVSRGPGVSPVWCHPRGTIWEPKTTPEPTPKRSRIEAKIQDEKKRSKTILDPSSGDLGPFGCHLGRKKQKTDGTRNVSRQIAFSKIRRFEDGSWTNLGPKRRPNDPNITPKRDPRSIRKRSKCRHPNRHKFWCESKGSTRESDRKWAEVVLVVWGQELPPQGAPQGLPEPQGPPQAPMHAS